MVERLVRWAGNLVKAARLSSDGNVLKRFKNRLLRVRVSATSQLGFDGVRTRAFVVFPTLLETPTIAFQWGQHRHQYSLVIFHQSLFCIGTSWPPMRCAAIVRSTFVTSSIGALFGHTQKWLTPSCFT